MDIWAHIEEQITQHTERPFKISNRGEVGGGCINTSCRISDGARHYFVKVNHSDFVDMFEAEAQGLLEMADSKTIMVPEPVCYGSTENQCYVVMQYLDLAGRPDSSLLAHQLAAMHGVTSDRFGWHINNTIGSTLQVNTSSDNWIDFWREHRLGFQLQLAANNGYGGKLQSLGDNLLSDLPALFESYNPQASMLHGDLWGGNYGGLSDGTPVIFDPAFYYGDREAELAMTTLFGGFSADFYSAYDEVYPLDDGYSVRKQFYNIYHVINHLNLFGGGYQAQAIDMMKRVLAELH